MVGFMKLQISATIDYRLLEALNRLGQEKRLSRSQIIEMALEEFLRNHGAESDEIVTSEGRYAGAFRREEGYERVTR